MNQTGGAAWRWPARTSRIGLEGVLFIGGHPRLDAWLTRALRSWPSRTPEGHGTPIPSQEEATRFALAAFRAPMAPILLEFDGLVLAILIQRCSPDLVRRLMFGAAETERCSKTQIQIAHALQRIDQLFGVELRSGTRHRLDQHVRAEIAFQRSIARG